MDLLGETEPPPIDAPDAFGVFAISAAARQGLDALLAAWWSQLLDMQKAERARGRGVEARRASLTHHPGHAHRARRCALSGRSSDDLQDTRSHRSLDARVPRDPGRCDRAVAIVGTRRATALRTAGHARDRRRRSREPARASSAAWRAASTAPRTAPRSTRTAATIAVLGTGLDVAYPAGAPRPPAHDRGARACAVRAGADEHGMKFRSRNAIASSPRSRAHDRRRGAGAERRARSRPTHALELGTRIVAAVPGPIDLPQSAGINRAACATARTSSRRSRRAGAGAA